MRSSGLIRQEIDMPSTATHPPFPKLSAQGWFWAAVVVSFVAKFWLAATLPLTGDEYYYALWGIFPAGGYYDQPPMIGWWMSYLAWAAPSAFWLRLPAILLSVSVVPFLIRWLKPYGLSRAYWVGVMFLLSPLQLLFVVITTDIPLIFYSVVCVDAFWRALDARTRERQTAWALTSGVFLGLAFLSKYFALLLPFCFLLYGVFLKRDVFRPIVLMTLAALPFALQHLYWNSQNCWANVVFNLYSRHSGEDFDIKKPLLWLAYQAYQVTPPLLWLWLRVRPVQLRGLLKSHFGLLAVCTAVPLFLFGLSSLKYGQGLHWTITYYVFFFALTGILFSERQIISAAKFLFAFSLVHFIGLAWLASLGDREWKGLVSGPDRFRAIQMFRHAPGLSTEAARFSPTHVVAADGYTLAALLSVQSGGAHIPVFGSMTRYGRFDDMLTHFRDLEGRNLAIFSHHEKDPSEFAPFFARVTRTQVDVGGTQFFVFLGEGFRFEPYQIQVIEPVLHTFYPKSPLDRFGRCELRDRYRPDHPALHAPSD